MFSGLGSCGLVSACDGLVPRVVMVKAMGYYGGMLHFLANVNFNTVGTMTH